MKAARVALVSLTVTGLVASAWHARPLDGSDVGGWGFAIGWTSLAWLIGCWGAVRWSLVTAAAGFLALATSEAVLETVGDPLFLVMKPLWQVGALVAAEVDPIPRTGMGLILKPSQVQGCPRRRSALATYRPTRWATRVPGRDVCALCVSSRNSWVIGTPVRSADDAGCTNLRPR